MKENKLYFNFKSKIDGSNPGRFELVVLRFELKGAKVAMFSYVQIMARKTSEQK